MHSLSCLIRPLKLDETLRNLWLLLKCSSFHRPLNNFIKMTPLLLHHLRADRKEQSNRSRTAQKATRGYCCVPLTLANPHLAPGQHQGEKACQQKVFTCGFMCQRSLNRVCVQFVWEPHAFLYAPPHTHTPTPQAGQNGTGRRAPNWAQMAATDKDGGGMNMLINNYQNNDIQ